MTDPLSVAASVLAVATATAVSIRSLCDTVKSFQNRNNTLRRLQSKLQDLVTILDSLIQVIDDDTSVLALLEGPIDRCKEICSEFEQSIKKFHGKSKTGLLDWTKLEFMKGDINDFIDTIEGYKSTITVGLGTINLHNSKISYEVLQQYEEMIKDTAYNLEVHLQQIDEKLTRYNSQGDKAPVAAIDLQDERAVTQQCLRICKDASSYIDSLTDRASTLLQDEPQVDADDDLWADLEAPLLTRRAINTSQANFVKVINCLGERLQSMVLTEGAANENERSRLQQDINISKQCLHVCKVASEISSQKIHKVGEAVAEEDSDQVVVTTLADLFEVRRAISKGRSAQLVATLTPENFDHVVEKRYSSRFAALPDRSSQTENASSPISSSSQSTKQFHAPGFNKDSQPLGLAARRDKPNPNEMKKRGGNGESTWNTKE